MCFVAGTPVITSAGLLPIEAIKPGMLVLSQSEDGDQQAWKPVTQVFVTRSRSLIRLTVVDPDGNRETIDTTDKHPFKVDGQGWIEARALFPGEDLLIDSRGQLLDLEAAESIDAQVPVHNFEVADLHTYFVGHLGLWVHNPPGAAVPVLTPAQVAQSSAVGRLIPTSVSDSGFAQITRVNSDGSYNVQYLQNGFPHNGRSDAAGSVIQYPDFGHRYQINLPAPVSDTVDALIVGQNDDGSSEFEALYNGRRYSGVVPLNSSDGRLYPPPEKQIWRPGEPIGGHPIHAIHTPDGRFFAVVGKIWVLRPAMPATNPWEEEFLQNTMNDLKTIAATPTGMNLLNSLQGPAGPTAGPVTIKFGIKAEARPTNLQNALFVPGVGPGTGSGALIQYNPSLAGAWMLPATHPDADVRDRLSLPLFNAHWGRAVTFPSEIQLGHELIHAHDFRHGTAVKNGVLSPSEERAVGLGDFALTTPGHLSENMLRTEMGFALRDFYGARNEGWSTDQSRGYTAHDLIHSGWPGSAGVIHVDDNASTNESLPTNLGLLQPGCG